MTKECHLGYYIKDIKSSDSFLRHSSLAIRYSTVRFWPFLFLFALNLNFCGSKYSPHNSYIAPPGLLIFIILGPGVKTPGYVPKPLRGKGMVSLKFLPLTLGLTSPIHRFPASPFQFSPFCRSSLPLTSAVSRYESGSTLRYDWNNRFNIRYSAVLSWP